MYIEICGVRVWKVVLKWPSLVNEISGSENGCNRLWSCQEKLPLMSLGSPTTLSSIILRFSVRLSAALVYICKCKRYPFKIILCHNHKQIFGTQTQVSYSGRNKRLYVACLDSLIWMWLGEKACGVHPPLDQPSTPPHWLEPAVTDLSPPGTTSVQSPTMQIGIDSHNLQSSHQVPSQNNYFLINACTITSM